MKVWNDCYFIDMELCNLTLHEYIKYCNNGATLGFEVQEARAPVFVHNDCSSLMRMRNIWTIMTHIVLGLEFMHKQKQAHRDLKPSNGAGYVYQN
jgi:serine/threonine protein kinase